MSDYDPSAIKVQSAATVMLVRQRDEIEVLMLRRNARSVFVGDMWVFPGGGVDEEDRDPTLYEQLREIDLSAARSRLDLQDAPAYWVATIRETFEEAGVLIALDRDGRPVDPHRVGRGEYDAWRDGLNNGSATMRSFLDDTGLLLDGSQLAYVARFITPVGPPRRYDARFFLAHAPEHQIASVDNDEAVGHTWVAPTDALRFHEAGDMAMMTPTLACLRRLATYESTDDAIAAARAGDSEQRLRINLEENGIRRIVFAEDAEYEQASESEFGWLGI
jgi:8-oxo-dGTP pyrophosphatase MutT (NUDIX family)